MAGNSIYEVNNYQDMAKPSDVLNENDYLQDVFFVTRPEVIDYDDKTHDKNPYFDQCRNDEPVKEQLWDEQKYIHNPRNLDERNTPMVNFWKDKKKKYDLNKIISSHLIDNCSIRLSIDMTASPKFEKMAAKPFEDILRATGELPKKFSGKCAVRLIKTDDKNNQWTFRVWGGKKDSNRRGHEVRLKIFPDSKQKDIKKLPVDMTCSCPFWVWYGPDYHAKHEDYLLDTQRSNGEAPDVNDPENRNKVCKHIWAVSQAFNRFVKKYDLDTYKQVDSIIELLKERKVLDLEDIKEVYKRLLGSDKKEIYMLINRFPSLKTDEEKTKLREDIIEKIEKILGNKNKDFLLKLEKDIKATFKKEKSPEKTKKIKKTNRNIINIITRLKKRSPDANKEGDSSDLQEIYDSLDTVEQLKLDPLLTKYVDEGNFDKRYYLRKEIIDKIEDSLIEKDESFLEDLDKHMKSFKYKIRPGIPHKKSSLERIVCGYLGLDFLGDSDGDI